MKKRIAVFILLGAFLLITFSGFVSVSGATSNDINSLQKELLDLQSKQTQLDKQRKEAESKKLKEQNTKNSLDKEIMNTQSQINTLTNLISAINKDLNNKNDELEDAQNAMDEYYKMYKQRIRANYESDKATYIEVVLGAKSFSDLIMRVDFVSQIMDYDQRLLNQMKEKIAKIELIRNGIAERKKENDEAKNKMALQQSALKTKSSESQKVIKELEGDIKALEKVLDEIDDASKELTKKIYNLSNKNVKYTGGKLEWPTPGYYTITSAFGWRIHPITKTKRFHYGMDISGSGISGKNVVAANKGNVIFVGYTYAEGNVIAIDHGGITTQYKHLLSMSVSVGNVVTRGQVIGTVGSTGRYSTGAHLHFEVIENGTAVNPMNYYS